jgi:phage head maturation protease
MGGDRGVEGHFLERVAPGAFANTIRENRDRIRCLFHHGRDPHIGNAVLGLIRTLEPDTTRYEVDLLDVDYNRRLIPGLKAGLYGASFRFSTIRDEVRPIRAAPSTTRRESGK